MKWCVECGEAGKPEPATTTVEGDPLCAGHAKARGAVFNAEFLDRRMAEHKALKQEPSAPKEKVMEKKCACGCGADMVGSAWNYKRGHKPAHKAGQDVPAPKVRVGSIMRPPKHFARPSPVFTNVQVPGSDELDELWGGLSKSLRRKALRSLLEWNGVPNLA